MAQPAHAVAWPPPRLADPVDQYEGITPSLNIKAQLLILEISEYRGIDASNFHSRKYLR
jgi:hypothetical protein